MSRWEQFRVWMVVLGLGTGVIGLVSAAISTDVPTQVRMERNVRSLHQREATVELSVIDAFFHSQWDEKQIAVAAAADDLAVYRRASLALHGTLPSLEEIRSFEADAAHDRLHRRVRGMLHDPRFADYWAERLARAWVGVEGEPFLIYRREQFTRWIARQLRENRPYNAIARDVIATDGLWTSEPAANFVTSAVANDVLDHNELAARTVRGFLGQRIDCAQCHDHPFADWKQAQFEGLAAFFGQSAVSFQGVVDQPRLFENELAFAVDDPVSGEPRVVDPAVPYLPECLPAGGTRRERLAAWVTDRQNERFPRATVNRVWGLLFGKPYVEPVDDLADPGKGDSLFLDHLGQAFAEHDYDLRWLIESIVLSRPFRASSKLPGVDDEAFRDAEAAWAVFPLTRLRPEQMIGAILQASRLQTIDQNSHLFSRFLRFVREEEFVKEYGDAGDAELAPRSGTVSQMLLRMNGKLTHEVLGAGLFSSTGRLVALTPDDDRLVELCFLVTLTRRPTPAEQQHFVSTVAGTHDNERRQATEDLVWSLVNSAEFSWNH